GPSGSKSQRASADDYLKKAASPRGGHPAGGKMGPSGTFVPGPGELLAEKYRVEGVLGAGGMGVVVAARHVQLDLLVALKFMRDETLRDYTLVARFLREARATAKLRGEHVVRVSDVGELASGAPYMVMELLQGQDLGALLASLGPPPVASAVDFAVQACEGLHEAHRAGLVHRDVKPSNLVLTRRANGTPCIKIVDFGISKGVAMGDPIDALDETGASVFGSPVYMAPEQMRATRDVDARSDIWSLGVSLYEILTGHLPFQGKSMVELAYRIANEPPPSIVAACPDVSPELEQVVLRCLEKDPDRRFPDARSLADALERVRPRKAHHEGAADSDPDGSAGDDEETRLHGLDGPAPEAPPASPGESLADGSVSWGRSQRFARIRLRRRPYLAAMIVGGALLGGAMVVFLRGGEPAPQAPRVVAQQASVAPPVPLAVTASASPADEPPTVSVTDLPTASPGPGPSPPPLASPLPIAPPSPAATPPSAASAPAVASSVHRQPVEDPDGLLAPLPALPAPSASASSSAAPPASPAHTSPTNCSPPYFFDELGFKVFKPECVN
ncbi:MAG TPA: serine/threonine-protein kinase, partial [Polyangiaceae bacterium]|nr:serine/threonine-protein kinase [Polyangiaceae bacterium]